MKRSGQGQNITLTRSILQLISANIDDLILSSDWSLSPKLCSDWLGEHLTDKFQKWRQTNRQIDIFHKPLLNCSFAVKKLNKNVIKISL